MKKLYLALILILFAAPCLAADITIAGLTDAQANALVGQNLREYVGSLADYLIARKAADEKYQLIKVLTAKTDAELKEAVRPILEAESAKAAAETNKELIKEP